jgi:hypothetical protein
LGAPKGQERKWAQIIRLYEAGEKLALIADQVGVDLKTVYNVARRAGLPHRHLFDAKRTARIVSAYRAGTPVHKIAASEGVHRSYVRTVARKAGLPARSNWRRRYPLDEMAFDEPTATGWWLVGLIAADGHIGTRDNLVCLTQSEADIDVLHEFLKYVGCPNKPLTELKLSPQAQARTYSRRRAFAARVQSRHMCESLACHGITPRKSRTLRLSEEAAEEPAVWLGLLDGDGWVSARGKRGRPLIDFSGAPAVIEQCAEFWGQRLTFQRVSSPTVGKHSGGLRRVRLYGANASSAARILLASSPVSLRRKRRILEAIASLDVDLAASAPVRMRTSINS